MKTLDKFRIALFAITLIGCGILLHDLAQPKPAQAASQFATILCDNFKPVSSSANLQLITAGNANMFVYICSYQFSNGNAAATPFSLVEGTGSTCATNTAAVVGTTTAANGVTLAASGGTVNYGGGSGVVAKTAVAGDNVCLFVSQGPVSGVVGWTTAAF